jgi:hypothetical protein
LFSWSFLADISHDATTGKDAESAPARMFLPDRQRVRIEFYSPPRQNRSIQFIAPTEGTGKQGNPFRR